MKVAAISLLCADARVFEAMAQSGTCCPINGKIGTQDQEEWLKYGKLRPDYETYVAALRITEQIDNERGDYSSLFGPLSERDLDA